MVASAVINFAVDNVVDVALIVVVVCGTVDVEVSSTVDSTPCAGTSDCSVLTRSASGVVVDALVVVAVVVVEAVVVVVDNTFVTGSVS